MVQRAQLLKDEILLTLYEGKSVSIDYELGGEWNEWNEMKKFSFSENARILSLVLIAPINFCVPIL
jgi:hypothetical protein